MYQDEPFVQKGIKDFNKLMDDVLVRHKVEHINYADEIPGDFTKEKYIAVYAKIWASIRHDMWKEIKMYRKKDRV